MCTSKALEQLEDSGKYWSAVEVSVTKKSDRPAKSVGPEQTHRPRILGYALPRDKADQQSRVFPTDEFDFHDEPMGSAASFLDFDGVVLFAGAYDAQDRNWMGGSQPYCLDPADLDLRQREFNTIARQGRMILVMVPPLAREVGHHEIDCGIDLFRRIMHDFTIDWKCWHTPDAAGGALIPEFEDFVSRFGTAYVEYGFKQAHNEWVTPIFEEAGHIFGFEIKASVFFLPCARPPTHARAAQMAMAAARAGLAYRTRVLKALRGWLADFTFAREQALRDEARNLDKRLVNVNAETETYRTYKGILALQSAPLVKIVKDFFHRFFGISLTVEEKYVEDATLRSPSGDVEAVFEIKGVKGNFTRATVSQVDSHRERLSLPPLTPGVLVMNTCMDAGSLSEKDQAPHPDIIKKAVADRVLLIRTLDLLRYADAIEKGALTKESFRDVLLHKSGWLKVQNDALEVVTQ